MSKITYADKVALNTNTEIPAQNKVKDSDMNDIKTAVNQVGSYNVPTAGSNADYSLTLKGTLSSGDVVNIYFPTPANVASNARLSVNGGSNYYNIQYDGANLIGNNVRGKYLTLVFNGTIFEALGFKSNIIAVLSSNVKGTNANPTKLPLALKSRFGTKFSISNGGVLIPVGVTKVKISAQAYVKEIVVTGTKKALVYLNGNSLAVDGLQSVSSSYWTIPIVQLVVDVTPGDILYLYGQGGANDLWEGNGSVQFNRLFVEEVI